MVQVQLPNKVERIIKICALLMLMGTFAIIVIGSALIKVQYENVRLEQFLSVGKTTHIDFENSLIMYTEKTRDTITYLLGLRPNNEEEVINFISEIERIGQDTYLDIELAAMEELIKTKGKKTAKSEDTISYKISFFGSIDDLNEFLSRIEALPYFVRIENAQYRDISNLEESDYSEPNVTIIIRLYVKNDQQ